MQRTFLQTKWHIFQGNSLDLRDRFFVTGPTDLCFKFKQVRYKSW